tara:strand:+ start:81 stop:782 length:702 start_codon:yes stop_codon:yes gene_type:complete
MIIEFISADEHVNKHFPIIPAKQCLPKWYKDLKATNEQSIPTITGCMPVKDMVTAGYIIPNIFEQEIIGTSVNQDGEEELERVYPVEEMGKFWEIQNHMTHPGSIHHHAQCPVLIDGKKKSYFKISLPWRIKTPPGYSCLFVQPFYHFESEFVIMPSIIDTDEHDSNTLNFPGYLKDPVALLKAGQPLVQVIPFKRDDWEHTTRFEPPNRSSKLNLFLHNMYKRAFHKKKKFN